MYKKLIFLVSLTSDTNGIEQDYLPFDKTFKQRHFLKEDFHYLKVTPVGMFTMHDLLECKSEFVRNALCLSINMASSKGEDGELWCELSSLDKYRDTEN